MLVLILMLALRACACRAQLRRRREEGTEVGGYFICNGLERVIRLLIQQRRHHVMALRRGAYAKRGPAFTDAATLMRRAGPCASTRALHCMKWRVLQPGRGRFRHDPA